jgi:hypothetical protein
MSSRPKQIENPEHKWTADGTSANKPPSPSKYRNRQRVPSGRRYAIGEHLERTPFINMKAVLREKSLATAALPQGTIASRIHPVGVAQEDLAQVPTSQDDTATATSTTSPSRTTTNRLTCTILSTSEAQELSHRDAEDAVGEVEQLGGLVVGVASSSWPSKWSKMSNVVGKRRFVDFVGCTGEEGSKSATPRRSTSILEERLFSMSSLSRQDSAAGEVGRASA